MPEQMPQPVESEKLNSIVNDAIVSVIEAFGNEISLRDRELLTGLTLEKRTDPVARVYALRDLLSAQGISDNLHDYINHILYTLRDKVPDDAKRHFITGPNDLLQDLP